MSASDLPAILVIEHHVNAYPWAQSHFESSMVCSHHCYVLHHHSISEDKTVIGYAITSTAADEAELLNIAIAPTYQRQGLGGILLQSVSQLFDSAIQTLFLEVRSSNYPAIAFYEAQHFNQVGVRRGYYPSQSGREDALIMAKALQVC